MVAGAHFQPEAPDRPNALVADDDVIMRDILRSLLLSAGYTVMLAVNGREALTLAANSQASIAFIDLAMPEGNGLQTCAVLRKMPKWSNVPIIVLTHYSLNEALKASLDAGANGFLCKPLVPSEFLWCLEVHTMRPPLTIVGESSSQFTATDHVNFSTEQLPPFRSPWMLQTPQASFKRQLDALNKLEITKTINKDQSTFPVNLPCPNLIYKDCLEETQSSVALDGENVSAQNRPFQANMQSGYMSLAPDIETLCGIAALFAPGGFARLLELLIISIDEILLMFRNGEGAVRSYILLERLHKLAGTAGTLGCSALSVAARELEYNFSASAECHFNNVSYATLDVIRAYVAEQSGSVSRASPAARSHVLVVDDTLINRDIASAFLCAAGHVVTCVEGGAAAVAAVAMADFDVVLMDVRMPEVDGLEATRRIRKLEGARGRVPIVALTAQAFVEQIAECRRAGMDEHLAKPFDRETLLIAVARAIDAKQHHEVKFK